MTGCKSFADFDAGSDFESFDDSDMAGVLAPEGDYEDDDCSCSVPSNEASNDDQTNMFRGDMSEIHSYTDEEGGPGHLCF